MYEWVQGQKEDEWLADPGKSCSNDLNGQAGDGDEVTSFVAKADRSTVASLRCGWLAFGGAFGFLLFCLACDQKQGPTSF